MCTEEPAVTGGRIIVSVRWNLHGLRSENVLFILPGNIFTPSGSAS